MSRVGQRTSGPKVWDKAKWHAEESSPAKAARHIYFMLKWLKRKELTTWDGNDETAGSMGQDTSLNSDMVTERGTEFLNRYYDQWLDVIDSKSLSQSRSDLGKFWNEFNQRFPPTPDQEKIPANGFSAAQNAVYQKFRRKELSSGIEVEHIIAATLESDASLIPVLKKLCADFEWKEGENALRSRSVPMGSWVKVCSDYLNGGNSALVSIVKRSTDQVERECALSVVEELKPNEGSRALLDLMKWHYTIQAKQRMLAKKIVSVANFVFSFNPAIKLTERERSLVRNYIHKFLSLVKTQEERSAGYYALREIGNEESISIIESAPPLGYPREGAEKDVVKRIRRRISKL